MTNAPPPIIDAIWLVPLLPLIGVLLNGFFGPSMGRRFVSVVGCAAVGAAFLISLGIWQGLLSLPPEARVQERVLYDWIATEPTHIQFGFRIDPLSVTMILVVTGVGFLIHLYSTGYMWEDPRFARYFAWLNLFTVAMLILVLAKNYLLMFVGWEGVGLCSYLLIGFYFERWSAAQAGKKAFIINRVGDFGFLLAMFLLYWYTGSLEFGRPPGGGGLPVGGPGSAAPAPNPGVFRAMETVSPHIAALIGFLLLLGATGKSAQLPLYLWLPDAMEGPTPVSALIHAATMVTAGVYMIARSHAIYERAPEVLSVVAIVGAVTALFAATVAVVQNDIKRVLAYSTVSQLGYMFLGVGVGAYAAGIFHLVTHAFFKALLFLGAGSVMHSLAGQLDMRKMGGLSRYMKLTWLTFAVGWLAICGIPPFAGFYSKDAILSEAYGANPVLWMIGLFTAGLTAFYMSRMFFTTFHGPERIELGDEHHGEVDESAAHVHEHASEEDPSATPHSALRTPHPSHTHVHADGHVHVHESPPVMTLPLVLLALGSVVVGFMLNGGLMPHAEMPFRTWLAPSIGEGIAPSMPAATHALSESALIGLSVLAGVIGIIIAGAMHAAGLFVRARRTALGELIAARFGYDALLHAIFVRGGWAFAVVLWEFFDVAIIDGIVNGVGVLTRQVSRGLRTVQTGYVRNYALVMLVGAVVVIAWYLKVLG